MNEEGDYDDNEENEYDEEDEKKREMIENEKLKNVMRLAGENEYANKSDHDETWHKKDYDLSNPDEIFQIDLSENMKKSL
jgi:hypothetical protein